MSSLTTHLRRVGSHAGLRFHPDCRACREERLRGRRPANPILAHRTLAALTAGLLAVSAGAPTPVVAAGEPDQEQSGAADPAPSNDSARNPENDPGGPTATAPNTSDTTTPRPGDPDPAADPEPARDTPAQVADPGDRPDVEPHRRLGSAPTQTPATPATPETSANPTSTAGPLPAGLPPTVKLGPRAPHARAQHPERPKGMPRAVEPLGTSMPDIQPSLPAVQTRANTPTGEPSTGRPTIAGTRQPRGASPRRGARIHVVVAGESLWSIASDLLDRGASNADIAREVHRMWELNVKTIGTGSPDLLPVGTKLRLR